MQLKKIASTLALILAPAGARAGVADFEEVPLGPGGFYNGADGAGGFVSGGARFSNSHEPTFGLWDGFAVSNHVDTTTPGFGNQYSAIAGSGAGGSAQYAVAYVNSFAGTFPTITLPPGESPQSVAVTNTTYAYLSMRDGDAFAKKFGGDGGDDPDFFKLIITGHDALGDAVGMVEFFLADFRPAGSSEDHLVDEWISLDLSGLGGARSLAFSLETTDVGAFGPNTPMYFAIDNLVMVPEPGLALGLFLAAAAAAQWRRLRRRM